MGGPLESGNYSSSFLPPDASSPLEGFTEKQEIAQRKERISDLRQRIRACKAQMNSAPRTGTTRIKIGHWRVRAKQKDPIGERMVVYLEIVNLRRQIQVEKKAIADIKLPPIHRVRRVEHQSLEELQAEQPPQDRRSILKRIRPGVWCKSLADRISDAIRDGKLTDNNLRQVRAMSALIREATERLEQLQTVKDDEDNEPLSEEEVEIIDREIALINQAIQALEHQIRCIPVVEGIATSSVLAMRITSDSLKVTRALSAGFMAGGQSASVVAQIGFIISSITVPLTAILATLGVTATIENARTVTKDLFTLRRYSTEAIEEYRSDLEAMTNLCANNDLFTEGISGMRARVEAANAEILVNQREIARIDRELIKGVKDERHANAFIAARQMCQDNIAEVRSRLRRELQAVADDDENHDCVPAGRLLQMLETQWIAQDGALALQVLLVPYLKERVGTKSICVAIRAVFDAAVVTGAVLGIIGLASAPSVGGAGLLALGGIIGVIGALGQFVAPMIVKRIRALQYRKKHIDTPTFNAALRQRLRVEVDNWERLQAAGITDMTAASMMFSLLKRNYAFMPKDWGPREWADALLDDPYNTEEGRYKQAMTMMKEYDTAGFIYRGIIWPARRLHRRWVNRRAGRTDEDVSLA